MIIRVKGDHFKFNRWIFQANKEFIGFIYQTLSDGRWRDSHVGIYGINFFKTKLIGFNHIWYDGPHCALNLYFIQIQWFNAGCKKCI